MKFLLFVSSALLCCTAGITATHSIVEFPYFAAIEHKGNHVCSATVVDDFYVMTTNSCVGALDVNNLRVRVSTDRRGFRGAVFKVIGKSASPLGDVAMVKLASAMPFNPRLMPVNPNNYGIQEGQSGTLVGWANSKKLRSPLSPSEVYVLPSANCSTAYTGVLNITDNMFCLWPSDTNSHPCQADLGSPLYYNEQYYGLVTSTPGCTDLTLPVVVTAVSPFTQFLIAVLCGFEQYM